jgi:uncharacterized Zn-finger protein
MTQRPCQKKQYLVKSQEETIVCPPVDERIWDAHPRVYLKLDENHHIHCPYCGTEFILQEESHGR